MQRERTSLHIERANTRWDIFRHAVRESLVCAALVLLVLFAVVISPIQRSSTSDPRRPLEGLRRNFALPASDSSRLSVSAWIMREDAVVTARSEDDEDDDDKPCNSTQQPNDAYHPSLPPSRSAPTRNIALPSRLVALHPLRC